MAMEIILIDEPGLRILRMEIPTYDVRASSGGGEVERRSGGTVQRTRLVE